MTFSFVNVLTGDKKIVGEGRGGEGVGNRDCMTFFKTPRRIREGFTIITPRSMITCHSLSITAKELGIRQTVQMINKYVSSNRWYPAGLLWGLGFFRLVNIFFFGRIRVRPNKVGTRSTFGERRKEKKKKKKKAEQTASDQAEIISMNVWYQSHIIIRHCKWRKFWKGSRGGGFTWKVDNRTIPTRPAWSTIPTSKAHSLPRLRTWRCIQGCLIPKALLNDGDDDDLVTSRDTDLGHWIYVVWMVGDWICSTVWSSSYPWLWSSCSEILGRCKRELGGGGDGGFEYRSCRKWRKESEGSDVSNDVWNKANGSEPVEENKDIIDGCTDAEKSIYKTPTPERFEPPSIVRAPKYPRFWTLFQTTL